MKDWIPLLSRLVWPIILILIVLIFLGEVKEFYGIFKKRVESGASVGIGGFIQLGQIAKDTNLESLSTSLSIQGPSVSGVERGGVTKESVEDLNRLKNELRNSPDKKINTLLITDKYSNYSVRLFKNYISSLSLKYVVFQFGGKYYGWINSSNFVGQLPPEPNSTVSLSYLRDRLVGVNRESIKVGASAKDALRLMQQKRLDSLPVINENEEWLFIVEREQILSDLISALLFKQKNDN